MTLPQIHTLYRYMLFASWEVRIVKTVTEVLKMLSEAAGRMQHFQVWGSVGFFQGSRVTYRGSRVNYLFSHKKQIIRFIWFIEDIYMAKGSCLDSGWEFIVNNTLRAVRCRMHTSHTKMLVEKRHSRNYIVCGKPWQISKDYAHPREMPNEPYTSLNY